MSGPTSKIGNLCPKIGSRQPRPTSSAALYPGTASGSKLCSSIRILLRTTQTDSRSTWIISRTALRQDQFCTTHNRCVKPDSKSGTPNTTNLPSIQKRKTSLIWFLWRTFERQLLCLWRVTTFWQTWRTRSGLEKPSATLCSTSKWSQAVISPSRWAKTWLGSQKMWWTLSRSTSHCLKAQLTKNSSSEWNNNF